MSSVVLNQTIDVLSKALKTFAGEEKTDLVRPSDIALRIALSDIDVDTPSVENPIVRVKGEPYYRVLKQEKPCMRLRKIKEYPGQAQTDEVTFLQILDVKFDVFQVGSLAKPFLMDAISRLCEELNSDILNNPSFQMYLDEQVIKRAGANATDKEKEKVKAEIISEETYVPFDLELRVITAKLKDVPGKAPNEQDAPIRPIPFLYAKDELIKQLRFKEDIFQMVD